MWIKQCHKPSPKSLEIGGMVTIPKWVVYDIVLPTLLLMDKVMHLVTLLPPYLQGFTLTNSYQLVQHCVHPQYHWVILC